MRSINWIFYVVVIISFFQCKVYQVDEIEKRYIERTRNNIKPTGEKGECFAKCLIYSLFEFRTGEYTIFTGDEVLEDVDIELRKIVIQQSRTKWIRKKTDQNCFTSDKKNCYTWCIVEQPEIVETIKILLDTTQSENYEIRLMEYEVLLEKGGFTEWKPVLCEADLTDSILGQIQDALRETGYYKGENSENMNAEIKASLVEFQEANYLPVGNLDLETLDFLGVTVD